MKKIVLIISIFVTILFSKHGFSQNQSFHSHSIEKSDGSTSSFGSVQGKIVLVMVTAVDTTFDFSGLTELQKKYPDLIVLELPVKQLAKSAPVTKAAISNVLVAKESKDSTDINGQLLTWLTRKEGNKHFSVEQLKIGQKFFIDGTGELYAVMPPEFKLSDPRIDAILTRGAFVQPSKN